jgi:ParB family transcriptional regulator, chromosome partitioning protein|tara:strand:+ start:23583 stop:24434 length:852 start_codon:yes stop_codon:yes gene_type:complete
VAIVSHLPAPSAATPEAHTARAIPIELIRPGAHQARRRFNDEALNELARSIGESGVIQPVVVRSRGDRYELLAGERRWRAAQRAGLARIPALVRDDLSDAEAFVVGLIENLQRESLSPIDTALGLKRLAELHGLTHGALGQRIGKSRAYVTHFLRLLNLHAQVQEAVDAGQVSMGHAKVLAGLPLGEQPGWLARLQQADWSVRALEKQLQRRSDVTDAVDGPPPPPPAKSADWLRLEREIADAVGASVSLKADPQGRGTLTIGFHSLDALDGVLAKLGLANER